MSKASENRTARLLPDGKPRYVRCYDDGKSADRYTVVYTGNYTHNTAGEHWYLGMSSNPFHPQGIGQHGTSQFQIDRPLYSHLGRKIKFDDLPGDCQTFVLENYVSLWNITDHPLYSE